MKTITYRPGVVAFELEPSNLKERLTIRQLRQRGVNEDLLKIIEPYFMRESGMTQPVEP